MGKILVEFQSKGSNQVKKDLQKLDKEFKELGDSAEQTSSKAGKLNNLKTAAAVAALATLSSKVVDVLKDVTLLATEFDTGIRQVETLLTDSQRVATDWGSAFKRVSIETGKSLGDVTQATYQALSAGIDQADVIAFVTEQNKLATGGLTNLSSAIDVTTKTLNAYGLEASEASRINDILIATQNNGITTVDELSSALAQVTPTAAAMGVEFEQVGAALATMTAQGTSTSQATTQLNTLLAELGKEGTVASKTFKKLTGKGFADFIKEGGDVGEVIQIMNKEAQANDQTLIDMFGSIEAGKAAMQLANGEGETFSTNLDAMARSAGASGKAFDDMTDGSPAFALSQASAAADSLKVSIGENLTPAIEPLISLFTSIVKKLQENKKLMKVVTAIILTLAITTTIFAVALGILAIQAFIASIAINSLLWPILLVISVVVLIAALVVLFADELVAAWEWIKKKTIQVFVAIARWLINTWNNVKTSITNIVNAIRNSIINRFNAIKAIVLRVVNALKSGVIGAFNTIKSGIGSAINWVIAKLEAFKNKVISIKNIIVRGFRNIVSGISIGIQSGIDTLISTVKNAVNNYAIGPLNSAIGTINKIPKVNIPNIPYLAKGGVVGVNNNGTLAMVGEAGPEAVIPLKSSVLGSIGRAIYESTNVSKVFSTNNSTSNNSSNTYNIEINAEKDVSVEDLIEKLKEALRILGLEGAL